MKVKSKLKAGCCAAAEGTAAEGTAAGGTAAGGAVC